MKKKFFYFLLLALPALCFVSCSDDGEDLPDVDFSLEFEGGVDVDGAIYVVRGETLEIKSITVTNNDKDKSALITSATYYWDAFRIGISAVPPYGFNIVVSEEAPLGRHELAIECPVYAVDKSPAVANLFYKVMVVESADDIPGDIAGGGSVEPEVRFAY